ncbi:MAG: hypothetical protein ACXV3C_15390, partial [Actinomycetes bacterium]
RAAAAGARLGAAPPGPAPLGRARQALGHPPLRGDNKVLSAAEILAAGQRWFAAGRIVIGHANHPAVTAVLDQFGRLLAERRLRTVTLADIWTTRGALLRGASAQGVAAAG